MQILRTDWAVKDWPKDAESMSTSQNTITPAVPLLSMPPLVRADSQLNLQAAGTDTILQPADGVILIAFEIGDPENPFEWPAAKKYVVLSAVFFYAFITACWAVAFGMGATSMERDLGVSGLAVKGGTTSYLV